MKCEICGNEKKKNNLNKVCKGCHAMKKIAKGKEKTSPVYFKRAHKHIDSNPHIINISWLSFWKKNKKVIV